MKLSKIYLDMDGVIADFTKRYKELFGAPPVQHDNKTKNFDKNFTGLIEEGHFATLDMMPDAQVLLNYLNTLSIPVEILSSTASEKRHDAIAPQKLEWLKKHGIDYKANLVPGKKFKKDWAKPDTLIIDDTHSIIDDWRNAGGIAIWHKDAMSTTNQVDCILRLDKYPYIMKAVDNPL